MNGLVRRCVAMTIGSLLVAVALLLTGIPPLVLLAIAPAVVCVALHMALVHGDPNGDQLLAAARRASLPRDHADLTES